RHCGPGVRAAAPRSDRAGRRPAPLHPLSMDVISRAGPEPDAPASERDFLELSQLGRGEVLELLALAAHLKAGADVGSPLAGKVLGMIFRKSSTRTRVSF